MAHDIFLASAIGDADMAKLVARRLRALKFKVRYDAKMDEDVFGEKESRDLSRAHAVLVLWSEKAIASDFVRAAASMAHSQKNNALFHAGLDNAIPYEPFRLLKRFDLSGMTSRKASEGWFDAAKAIGDGFGRPGLGEWARLAASDDDGKAAWARAHPSDPLAATVQAGASTISDDEDAESTTLASAVSAAALAASAIKTRPGTPAAVASAASPVASSRGQLDAGHLMLGGVGAAIAMLFALSVVYKAPRAKTVEASGPVGANAASADAAVCPAGYLPRSLFRTPPFEAGPVDPDR